jgi:putative DNA-invertase from lambdoid prophage Rac
MAKVYGYCRASTEKQKGSVPTQEELITAYCKRLGLDNPEFFLDPAVSGRKSLHDRPAGRQLLSRIQKGDYLIITNLDRLSRSLKDTISVLDSFQKKNIRLHAISFGGMAVDFTSPQGRFLVHTLAAVAEFMCALMRERTAVGLAMARKKRGVVKLDTIPPSAGLGFKYIKGWKETPEGSKFTKIKVVDENELKLMDKMIKMFYEDKMTYELIAAYLEVKGVPNFDKRNGNSISWSRSKVWNMIRYRVRMLAKEYRQEKAE